MGFFCHTACAQEFSIKAVERSREAHKKEATRLIKQERKNQSRARKEAKRTDLNWQHKLTQQSFNKMRVLEELLWFKERGEVATCISCNQPLGKDQWACGHYKTRGHNPSLRYDPKNTYLQHNYRCNRQMSGDIHGTSTTRGFTQGILERFGQVNGQARLDYCEKNTRQYAWHWRELEDQRALYNKKIKALTEALKALS